MLLFIYFYKQCWFSIQKHTLFEELYEKESNRIPTLKSSYFIVSSSGSNEGLNSCLCFFSGAPWINTMISKWGDKLTGEAIWVNMSHSY